MCNWRLVLGGIIILLFSPVNMYPNDFEPTPFSMQIHQTQGDTKNYKKVIDLVKEAGISQVRDEMYWSNVEREKGKIVIPENYKKNIDYSLSKGIETLLILDYGNDFYDKGFAPASDEAIEAFARYCKVMVNEFKGKIKYYEIWNEPNTDGFWRPQKDPKAYTKLLKASYIAIKEANPDTYVLGICSASIDENFIKEVFDEGGYDYMDGLSLHPYYAPRSPEEVQRYEKIEKIHKLMSQYGEPKNIWITEVGWPTHHPGGITQQEQADLLARIYISSQSLAFLKTTFWYWFGPDGPDREYSEDNFGILNPDYSSKPAYLALKNLTDIFRDSVYSKKVDLNRDIYIHEFKKGNEFIYALWNINVGNGRDRSLQNIIIETDKEIELIDIYGTEQKLSPLNNSIFITLCPSPIYICSTHQCKFSIDEQKSLGFEKDYYSISRAGIGEVVYKVDFNTSFGNFIGRLPRDDFNFKLRLNKNIEQISKREDIIKENDIITLFLQLDSEIKVEKKEVSSNYYYKGQPFAYHITELEVTEPIIVNVTPLPPYNGEKRFIASIKNNTDSIASGKIIFSATNKAKLSFSEVTFADLKPVESCSVIIKILSPYIPDENFWISARADVKLVYEQGGKKFKQNATVDKKRLISFYPIVKAQNEIKIDGKLDEWKNAHPIRLNDAKTQKVAGYGKWDGPQDSSANIYAMWDEKWIYIAGEFLDDVFSDPVEGFGVYNNDGMEIYFDTNYENDRDDTKYNDDDFQYGMFPSKGKAIVYSWSQLGKESINSKIFINKNPNPLDSKDGDKQFKYIIEGAIPLNELKLQPSDGKLIGFNVAITDDDDPSYIHPFFQELQLSWTGLKNAYQNPQAFGTAFFVDSKK